MKGLFSLGARLASARMRGRKVSLDVLAIFAYTVSTFLAFTVAGGVWMFVERNAHPSAALLALGNRLWAGGAQGFTTQYIGLAAIAAVLLVFPIVGLDTSAAMLGARSRASRLAVLRLVGATASQVTLLAVVEAVIQWFVGLVVGGALWLLSVPLWGKLRFQTLPIGLEEMLMPLWLAGAVAGTLLLLAVYSTVVGLQRVRISPLGVARGTSVRGLVIVRLGALVLALAAFYPMTKYLQISPGNATAFLALAGLAGGVLLAVNLIGPWVVQTTARLFTRTSSPALLLAMRRIIDDPKATWRCLSGIALLGFVATYVSMLPTGVSMGFELDEYWLIQVRDVQTGVTIALGITFVIAAVSTAVNQASGVLEYSSQARAQANMGMPYSTFGAIRRRQVLIPMVAMLAVTVALGMVVAYTMLAQVPEGAFNFGRLDWLGLLLGAGLAIMFVSVSAVGPVQRAVLAARTRRND